MGFQSQALQIWNRRRLPPTEKTNSDPPSLSLRIVPKLALPGFSEQIMDDENQGISELYSVFRFVTLPLLRERFIELAVENIYRGNKLTLDLELVDQFPLLSHKEPILYHFFKLGQWMVQKCTPEEILSVSQKLQDKGYSIFRNLLFNKRKFHDENLTFLGLSFNELNELNEFIFRNLTKLQSLNLSVNKLTSLPRGVFDYLFQLKDLRLENNNLSKYEISF
jgi:Leucine-rich repeat (LRR) protein